MARLSRPEYLIQTRGFCVFSANYGWAFRKSVRATVANKLYTFNARGYRGRELAVPRAGRATRVVVLGDSVAFGLGVSDDQTFVHLLDARDNGIDAANLAVQGYGPDQELLVLEREGLRLDPDVVVLAFCVANDLADAALPTSLYDGRMPKPRFLLGDGRLSLEDSGVRRPGVRRILQFLGDESHLLNRIAELAPRRSRATDHGWHRRYAEALADEEHVLRLNLALVRRMQELCRERGITFLLAAFPDRGSYGSKPPLVDRFFSALRGDGVAIVDMSIPFNSVGSRIRSVALDGTGHLSPLGHRLTANVLERLILAASADQVSATGRRQAQGAESGQS